MFRFSASTRTTLRLCCARQHRFQVQHSAASLKTHVGALTATRNFNAETTSANNSKADTVENIDREVVYESPLGNLVSRLRGVSLATGICGSLGLPLVVFAKGGDLPATGILAVGMTFVAGTLGSTAAIHFVFSPYIFTIERIPVRLCLYKKKLEQELREQGESSSSVRDVVDKETLQNAPNDVLYKATSKSLFLTRIETVFDPALDVVPYKGLRPLCNFVAKGKPLYVHPEYLYNEELRKAMQLDRKMVKVVKENPDDFL